MGGAAMARAGVWRGAVGGPAAVRDMIAEKRLGAIRFYDGERALQSKIAGLIWSQSYSVGGAFYQARNALPYAARKSSFDRYVADPYDGAVLGPVRLEAAFATVRDLHRWLLIPGGSKGWGRTITGACTLALIVFLATGLYLRWPKIHRWRIWLKPSLSRPGRPRWWSWSSGCARTRRTPCATSPSRTSGPR